MFGFDSRIRYSECGADRKLTLNALVDYFQDCTSFHSEAAGVGIDYLKAKNNAWFILNWQIVIDRMPMFCDKVKVCTQPYDFKGFYGLRNFWLEDESGNMCVKANSIWSFMDTAKGRPVKPSQEDMDKYGFGEKLEMEYAPRKMVLPAELREEESVEVVPHMIDTNNHMNNGQYIRIAMGFLTAQEPDAQVCEMLAEYKKSAVLGDVIHPYTVWQDDKFYVDLRDGAGHSYAVVALYTKGRKEHD